MTKMIVLHYSRHSKQLHFVLSLTFSSEMLFTQELDADSVADDLNDSEEESSSQEEDVTAEDSAESTSTGSALQTENQCLLSDDDSSDEYEDCEDEEEDDWQTCSEDEGGDKVNAIAPKSVENRTDIVAMHHVVQEQNRNVKNFSHLVQRNELLEIFKTLHSGPRVKDGEVNVGLVSWTLCLKWDWLNPSFKSIQLPRGAVML